MNGQIRSYKDLRVYQNAMEAAMDIFDLTKSFPAEERYSLVDQFRRASRTACSNIAEGWRKRRYKAAFIAKWNDAEGEASETQVWIEFSRRSKYLSEETSAKLDDKYEQIISQLVRMINNADKWLIKREGSRLSRELKPDGRLA
jgi:four helix bundle protein